MSAAAIFVGVDGGATRATALVTDAAGNALARAEGGPGLVVPGQAERVAVTLAQLVRETLHAAGSTPPAAVVCCALAGAGREPERTQIETELQRAGIAARVCVTTDAEAALQDAFANGPGLLLIAGTGSVAWGRAEDGRVKRAGGWGAMLGDEGSAYTLARHALRAVVRAHDGRGEPTALATRLLEQLELPSADALVAWTAAATKSDIAALAPAVLAVAAAADATALAIRERALAQLSAHVRTLHSSLGPWHNPPALACAGALLEPGGPLRSSLLDLLARAGPEIVPVHHAIDAARGAAAIARAGRPFPPPPPPTPSPV